jgi:DNA-binding response OmpR family regulator
MVDIPFTLRICDPSVEMLPPNGKAPTGSNKVDHDRRSLDSERSSIFILEDERLVAENLRLVLEDQGYRVLGIASSGEEAIDAVRRATPDLLILDIRVKGSMDGVETAILIHEMLGKRIPTLFLTAHSREHFGHLAKLDPNSFIYLTKPYGDEELLDAVDRLLNRR